MPRQRKVDFRTAARAALTLPAASDMTFGELCDAYGATVYDGAKYILRKWLDGFAERSAWSIEQVEFEACRDAMIANGYKPSTANRDLSQIGSIYRWAKDKRLTPKNFRSPTYEIRRLKEAARVVHVSEVERLKLIAGALANPDRRFLVYVRLLLETGARAGEITPRRWRHCDLDRGTLEAGKTKTGTPRVLFFSPDTAALMRRIFPDHGRDPNALIFEGRLRGCPITYRASWRNLVKAIGRPDLLQNDLRHARSQELLKEGHPVATVAQIMGHSSTVLQTRYGHLETKVLQAAARSTFTPQPAKG